MEDVISKYDEDKIVCKCMKISLKEIVTSIENGNDTIEKIGDNTDAGTACGSCRGLESDIKGLDLYLSDLLNSK